MSQIIPPTKSCITKAEGFGVSKDNGRFSTSRHLRFGVTHVFMIHKHHLLSKLRSLQSLYRTQAGRWNLFFGPSP